MKTLNDSRVRRITILKSRGMNHGQEIKDLMITNNGLEIKDVPGSRKG
jgi:hypothetical protein